MNTFFIEKEIKYIGSQLAPHWIYKNFNLLGDSIVAFIGEVEVKLTEMVDIEDVINNEPIKSDKMLSFIIEHFDMPLEEAIFAQRMLVTIIKENLEKYGAKIIRDGDDLFFDGKKLSVSIATKSITSSLIHTALNIVPTGAPIEISSLDEIGIKDVKKFAIDVMLCYSNEIKSIKNAFCKVRGV
ncbi:MAG: DUF366 family protein [Cyanobacteria bacterium SIG30]|nr:DUF366 family protein [Cyanobacteria bacterium SIG30]